MAVESDRSIQPRVDPEPDAHADPRAHPFPERMLVTIGEKETIPAKQAARKLVCSYPQAERRLVPRLGHVCAQQDPDLFSATVRAWMMNAPLPEVLKPL